MKRHQTHDDDFLGERMCDEFNEARNVKELALIAHLYIEYFVNELILAKLKKPEIVIDDGVLGTFKNKVLLLRAMGVFADTPHVLKNVELIQGVRNYYAHHLILTDDVPEPVISRIKQLVYFDRNEKLCDFDEPWSAHADPLQTQLQVCALETTNGLLRRLEAIPQEG